MTLYQPQILKKKITVQALEDIGDEEQLRWKEQLPRQRKKEGGASVPRMAGTRAGSEDVERQKWANKLFAALGREGRSLTTHLWADSKISANNEKKKKKNLELLEMVNFVFFFSPVKFISCPNKRNQLHSRKCVIPQVSTGIIHNLQDEIQRAQHTENITPIKRNNKKVC